MNQSSQPDIILSDPTWQKVCQWLEVEYADALKELSGLQVTEKKTEQLRGKAAFIRTLLDFEAAADKAA